MDTLLEYHQGSKHRLTRYAPGPGRLDWANQPNPFREFEGAPRIALPLAADTLGTRYGDLRAGRLPPPRAFDLTAIAILFELALGLSAWKSFGTSRWALRCNPSSGNLHPTEGYLVCPALTGLRAGVYHYVSRDHVLEQRAALSARHWGEAFEEGGVLVGLSTIYWREAWKYGMRAWRYCQHDCGHAIAALSYAAAALGWQTRMVESASDDRVAGLLGLDRDEDFQGAEREAPEVLLRIGAAPRGNVEALPSLEHAGVKWQGRANRLSAAHVEWRDIEAIHRATHRGSARGDTAHRAAGLDPRVSAQPGLPFARLARQRRSAVNFDGVTAISAGTFFEMLECLVPRPEAPPWNATSSPAHVHPAFMAHRVDGLEPGLYAFARDPAALPSLKRSMRPDWLWQKAGPEHLPLYLLLPCDLRAAAKAICCHQDIAADSCFALGMLAQFDVAMREPWRYRLLYWECGMLGQALYLEAEAAGVRATGIGCFFDDEMHGLLGIGDHSWQSLYHFTTGGPVDDPRLSTLPPYQYQP